MKALIMALAITATMGCSASVAADNPTGVPWTLSSDSWRTSAAWYDGLAEKCVYESTRVIYGIPRKYLATAYTNKQWMDPKTTTKATDAAGVEVFKHHWSERMVTENYDYDFSTASFVRCADLECYKLTASTQEDCGASFKQIWREAKATLWLESVYFPGGGVRTGTLPEPSFMPSDSLTLLLRDFPFGEAQALPLSLLPTQKDTHRVPFKPMPCVVEYIGREPLDLPVGVVETEHLRLSDSGGTVLADYWFASEALSPWLHALVQYEDALGQGYRLKSIERTAYWER